MLRGLLGLGGCGKERIQYIISLWAKVIITYCNEVGNLLVPWVRQLEALPSSRVVENRWSALRGIRITKIGGNAHSWLVWTRTWSVLKTMIINTANIFLLNLSLSLSPSPLSLSLPPSLSSPPSSPSFPPFLFSLSYLSLSPSSMVRLWTCPIRDVLMFIVVGWWWVSMCVAW